VLIQIDPNNWPTSKVGLHFCCCGNAINGPLSNTHAGAIKAYVADQGMHPAYCCEVTKESEDGLSIEVTKTYLAKGVVDYYLNLINE
jgi:hypothetical protein